MYRKGLLAGFLLTLVLALLGNPLPAHGLGFHPTVSYWQASYWNNTELVGDPVLQRTEMYLEHYWGDGAPATGINPDYFSARWTCDFYLELPPLNPPSLYRFIAMSDDGVRVWVDGELIIDAWYDHPAQTFTAEKLLGSGHHPIVVEYYERTGQAMVLVRWDYIGPGVTDWWGEYYANPTLSGIPALTRNDVQINFDWGLGAPVSGLPADDFSVRWTRSLDLPAGTYRFTMTVDDGGRLWVNNQLLLDAWREQPATTYVSDIYLSGGLIPIKMEYYERAGQAVARLSWQRIDGTPTPTPPTPSPGTVIVDDQDPGFVKGGSPSGWRVAYEGYNGRLFWTRNNDRARPNYNWARWYPRLQPGWYEVLVYIPDRYTTTAKARYWISHAGGFTLRLVNQSANGGRWVSLGTYRFRGARDEYVSLADVTFEPHLSRLIAFDAVMWVPKR